MKFLIFVFSMMPFAAFCQNHLIGTWSYDTERTLSELDLSVENSDRILKCYELEMCGSGSFIFKRDSFSLINRVDIENQPALEARAHFKYSVVNSSDESITITQSYINTEYYQQNKDSKEFVLNEELTNSASSAFESKDVQSQEVEFYVTDDGKALFTVFKSGGQKEYYIKNQ